MGAPQNFPEYGRENPRRFAFRGASAESDAIRRYMGKAVPANYMNRSPFRYCDPD